MSTTCYYESDLPVANSDKKRNVEIMVSNCNSYGTSEICLRVDHDESNTILIQKEEALKLLEALKTTVGYLGHDS
ncbi:MAG: hypothetical protein PF692_02115 [Kiritimatiellae bacterium]|jgi:hypothetical protein|nr:hypothetical protein [Kiritimatiellia bacterium]